MRTLSVQQLARAKKGLSQFELGLMVGLSEQKVARIEQGRIRPDAEMRRKIAEILEIPGFMVGVKR